MLTAPDTTTRIANSEAVTLSLDVDSPLSQAKLVPRFGEEQVLPLDNNGEFEFPYMQAPDLVAIEWLAQDGAKLFESYAEVVSRHYFTLDELKGYGDGQDDFAELSDETLYKARQAATEVFEEASHRCFVHRIGRTKDYGRERLFYLADNDVYELLTDGYRLASDCQAEPDGVSQPYPVWVEYLYGADVLPAQVSRAVLELAAYMLRPTNRPIGATGESTDAGYIHFTTAGRDGATDIPEVNAAIAQFGRGERLLW